MSNKEQRNNLVRPDKTNQTVQESKNPERHEIAVPKIGRYQIEETVSIRDQSIVFRAFDPDLERMVSLKVYHGSEDAKKHDQDRIISEGRALSRVRSNHVALCHTVETLNETTYLVNEWIDGQPLQEFLAENQLNFTQVRNLFTSIVQGVHEIHENGLLHRDLKPSNVIVEPSGTPKVIDLGLAQRHSEERSELVGTAVYVAPEVVNGESDKIGKPTDVFGLGGILYFLLTGQPLYQADSRAELIEKAKRCEIQPCHIVADSRPNLLDRVCMRCLAKDPLDRFQTASELLAELRPKGRKQLAIAVAAIAAMTLFAFAVWFANWSSDDGDVIVNDTTASQPGIPATPTYSEVEQAILDGDYASAIRLTQHKLSSLPSGDDLKDPRQLLQLYDQIADSYTEMPDIENAVRQRQIIVEIANEFSLPETEIDTFIAELKQAKELLRLNPAQLQEFARGKRLYRKSAIQICPGPNQAEIARQLALTALPLLEKTVGKHHVATINCKWQLASCNFFSDRRNEESVGQLLADVEKGLIDIYGPSCERLIVFYRNRFDYRLHVLGNIDGAMSDAQKALGIAEIVFGANSPSFAACKRQLGEVLIEMAEFKKADKLIGEAIEILQTSKAPPRLRVFADINRGKLYLDSGQYEKAEKQLMQVRKDVEANLPEFEEAKFTLAKILMLLSRHARITKRPELAIKYARDSLALIEADRLGKDSVERTKSKLAVLLVANNQTESALVLCEEVLSNPNLTEMSSFNAILAHMAFVNAAAKNHAKARHYLANAVQTFEPANFLISSEMIETIQEFARLDQESEEMSRDILGRIEQQITASNEFKLGRRQFIKLHQVLKK